jgi:hypothetical protein
MIFRQRIMALWPRPGSCVRLVVALSTAAMLSSCGGDDGSSSYALNVYVTGLTGSGLQVTLNGGAPIGISANSQTTLARLTNGVTYTVAIHAQPVSPLQTCTTANSSGTISGNNVDVMINCVAASSLHTVNGQIGMVSLDSSVTSAIRSKLADIVTPFDSQRIDTPIAIPNTITGGETMVLATDSANHLMLAALVAAPPVTLSIDSTAVALVRLTIGSLPTTASASQVNAAIQATAEYPNLVSLITTALNAGTYPATSTAVFTSIGTVISQLPAQVLATIAAAPNASLSHIDSLGQPTVVKPLPFTLSTSSKIPVALGTVGITDLTNGGSVEVSNSTGIAWAVSSATATNTSLTCPAGTPPPPANPDCSIALGRESVDTLRILPTTVTVPGNGGTAFNLTLEQNTLSLTTNVIQTGTDLVQIVINYSTGGAGSYFTKCVSSIVSVLLPASTVATLVTNRNGAAVLSYLASVASVSNGLNVVKALANCPNAGASVTLPIGSNPVGPSNFYQATIGFLTAFAKFEQNSAFSGVVTGANIAAELTEMAIVMTYVDTSFGVCEAKSQLGVISLVNCATQLLFPPSSLVVVPGGTTYTPVGQALDANQNMTPWPSDVQYASSNGTNTSILGVNPNTGAMYAPPGQTTASGAITVTATSASTGATGTITVNVNPVASITVSANPASISAPGTSVKFTAVLAPPSGAVAGSPIPTRTVTFSDSTSTNLCTATLSAGSASCAATITAALPDTVTALYSGDPDYAPSSGTVAISGSCKWNIPSQLSGIFNSRLSDGYYTLVTGEWIINISGTGRCVGPGPGFGDLYIPASSVTVSASVTITATPSPGTGGGASNTYSFSDFVLNSTLSTTGPIAQIYVDFSGCFVISLVNAVTAAPTVSGFFVSYTLPGSGCTSYTGTTIPTGIWIPPVVGEYAPLTGGQYSVAGIITSVTP